MAVGGFLRDIIYGPVIGSWVRRTCDAKLHPGLLRDWRSSDSGRIWRFTVADEASWSDGLPLTASDFVDALVRPLSAAIEIPKRLGLCAFIRGASGVPRGSPYRDGMIEGIRKFSEKEVEIELVQPNAAFVYALDDPQIGPMRRSELAPDLCTWSRWPVGAGAYRVREMAPDRCRYILERCREGHAGPTHLEIYCGPREAGTDISFAAEDGTSTSLVESALGHPSLIAGVYFDFRNDLALDVRWRRLVAATLRPEPLAELLEGGSATTSITPAGFESPTCRPVEMTRIELRAEASRLRAEYGPTPRIRIVVQVGMDSPLGELVVAALDEQFKSAGLEVELTRGVPGLRGIDGGEPPFGYFKQFVADVAGPAEAYAVFQGGGTWVADPNATDLAYKSAVECAGAGGTIAMQALTDLARSFRDNVLAVPLIERPHSVRFDPSRIAGLDPAEHTPYLDYSHVREATR